MYVSLHKAQHQVLQQLKDEHDYKGLDEGTRVRHLLAGIKENKLGTIKTRDLHKFKGTHPCRPILIVDLFKSFLEQVANDSTQTFNVSCVRTAGEGSRQKKGKGKWVCKNAKIKGGKSGKIKSDDEVKDRYNPQKRMRSLPKNSASSSKSCKAVVRTR